MRPAELREMTEDEILKKEEEMERQLLNLRFQLGTKQIENPMMIRIVRRGIARLKTIKRERSSGVGQDV